MSRNLLLLTTFAGALTFSAEAFAISGNGRVFGNSLPHGGSFGAARNHGIAGASPFTRGGGAGGRLPGGPHVGGAAVLPKK